MFTRKGNELHKEIQKKCKCGHPKASHERLVADEGRPQKTASGSCRECWKMNKVCKSFR